MDWNAVKAWFEAEVYLHGDALHIYVAVAIHVTSAVVFRRSLGSWVPWLIVLAAGFLNEFLDVRFSPEEEIQPWQVAEGVKDILNTMVMPTLILLLVRYSPARLLERNVEGLALREEAPNGEPPSSNSMGL